MFIIRKGFTDYLTILFLFTIKKINKVIKYKFLELYKRKYSKFKIFLT